MSWTSEHVFRRTLTGNSKFPIFDLFKFDEKNGTRLAFNSDSQFNDKTLRFIKKTDPILSKRINDYFWENLCLNVKADCVLFHKLQQAQCVNVCCVFVVYLLYTLLV